MDRPRVETLYLALRRYGGWLHREPLAPTVRADIEALGVAIETGANGLPALHALEAHIAGVRSGAIRSMLRRTVRQLRSALDEP